MQMIKEVEKPLDEKKRILKYCGEGDHWVVASTDYFDLVRDNYAPVCRDCEKKKKKVS